MHEDVVAVLDSVRRLLGLVADGEIPVHVVELIRVGVDHPRGLGDMFANVVEVALSARDLNHFSEHEHPGVAVRPPGAGIELERLVLHQLHPVVDRSIQCAGLFVPVGREVAPESRGVCQQMLDADLGEHVGVHGAGGEKLSERIVERELARFDELHHRDGREHLVHRPEVELGVDRVLDAEVLVRFPKGGAIERLPRLREEHSAGEDVAARHPLDIGLQLLDDLGVGETTRRGVGRRSGCETNARNARRRPAVEEDREPRPRLQAPGLHERTRLGGASRVDSSNGQVAEPVVHIREAIDPLSRWDGVRAIVDEPLFDEASKRGPVTGVHHADELSDCGLRGRLLGGERQGVGGHKEQGGGDE